MKYLLPGISIILLVLVVGGVAYYFGIKSTKPQEITPTPTAIETSKTQGTTQATTSSSLQTKTVQAGGVLSFPAYTLITPSDWNSQREQGQDSDKLTLSKSGYKIVISEGAFGGSRCLYPGDPPQEMAQTFSSFVQISNPNGFVFRRGANDETGWTVCQRNTSDGSFGAPTIFGHISITAPVPSNDTIVTEIDAILASIKK